MESCGLGVPGKWFALEHKLRDIRDNAESIGMRLNAKKTTLMIFNETKNKKFLPFCSLSDGDPLPVVSESRLLGVIVDKKRSWWPLVHDLMQRAKAKVWSLVKCREAGATKDQLVCIYIARVRSTLEYAAQVWDTIINESQSSEIESVQRKCFQIILGGSSGSYASNLISLGLKTLADRRVELVREFAISCFKSELHRW